MTTNQTIDGVPRAYDVESAARTLAECMDYSWDHMPEKGRGAIREYVALIIAAALPGNAEQPAPVARVLPDLGPDQQVEARAKEIYEGWSYNPGFAPWVDGGNSIMQSKARDLARRELAPVAAAQTCCGSCPGGRVYGLKA